MEAIGILGREVMQLRGLIGLGHDSIDFCGLEIAQVSTSISSLGSGFVYYLHTGLSGVRIKRTLPHTHSLYARQRSDWTACGIDPATFRHPT